jgi:hypothetical protein
VPAGYNQRMPRRHRVGVQHGDRQVIGCDDALRRDRAERAPTFSQVAHST